jgi:thiol-disulfide isomerase/thioredoxin
MRRIASALVFCAGLLPLVAANAAEKKTAWHTEFEAAKAESEKLQLPLLVHFYAEWCGPCRQMESGVLNSADVLAACGQKCVAVKIDSDARGDLAAKYGVAALPTDVFVSPDGKVLAKNVGQASRETYLARITDAERKCAKTDVNLAQGEAKTTHEVAVVLTQLASHGGIGLEGYSPVSLTTGKVWKEGSPEFAWRHAGVIYFMADAEELAKFKAEPQKYSPNYSGFDPLILSTEGVAVPGRIAYGSFYEGRLNLHATEESRMAFIKSPEKYPAPREIEVPAQIARQKAPVVASVPAMMGS